MDFIEHPKLYIPFIMSCEMPIHFYTWLDIQENGIYFQKSSQYNFDFFVCIPYLGFFSSASDILFFPFITGKNCRRSLGNIRACFPGCNRFSRFCLALFKSIKLDYLKGQHQGCVHLYPVSEKIGCAKPRPIFGFFSL